MFLPASVLWHARHLLKSPLPASVLLRRRGRPPAAISPADNTHLSVGEFLHVSMVHDGTSLS